MKLSFKKKCTCGSGNHLHWLNCDLMQRENSVPRKRKKFFIFYPLVEKRFQ